MMAKWCPAFTTLLDVGCGEGSFVRFLESRHGLELHGTDLSAISTELAARASPGALFVVANADRFLPYADQSFEVVTSINARVHPSEFERIITKTGIVLVAVPGPDDLIELRERIQGGRVEKNRAARILDSLADPFVLKETRAVREKRDLHVAELKDLLVATYRGLRRSEHEAVTALTGLNVTMSHEIFAFARG